MAATMVKTGRSRYLATVVATDSPNWQCWLFQNNITPNADTVLADLVPGSFPGYVPVALVFGGVSINASSKAQSVSLPVTFTFSGAGSSNIIYGYAIVNAVAGVLIFAERLAVPKSMAIAGDAITVTATATLTEDPSP